MCGVPGCGCGCGGVYIDGAGPDVAQSVQLRARSMSPGQMSNESGRRNTPGANIARNDFPALQQFPRRPAIRDAIGDADAGVTPTTIASLPGRIPPVGWDGENDARSPHANTGVT
jgi:hypothetical protein